ncbi:hypothetical protein N7481_004162 [Penicillium waksmanii]|uniref:uncharacterized protein n=1 Tax=Penicillium waksmanii TaxID=69791 RepID=UPI0025492D9F|nr:uncharacterized protein N7481_004162 [Penicillium waksmanii]KAJ5988952.1 hypothetical protein N7481_004162 [Penicillium waksmanii]
MTQRVMFAQGLKPANRMVELHPGQAYLHRFKSARRDYKTDIWVAIILPDDEIERHGLHRRPSEAKPADGTWITPTSERCYPCFLPARNTFRYASVKELFNLPEKPPARYSAIFGEEDEKLFQEVLNLARMSPEIDFWLKMADDEEIMKGKRGKEMELIRPDGYDHVFAKISSDSDSDDLSSDIEEAKSERSVPAGSNIARFPALTVNTPMLYIKQEEVEGPEESQQKELVLGMNFRQVQNHFLLRDEYRSTIRRIFQHNLDVEDQPEAEQICMFVNSGHFNPRVVEVKDPVPFANNAGEENSNDESQTRQIGDILRIGRKLQLQGIQLQGKDDIKGLQKLILNLGRLYKQARIFDIKLLMVDIIQKLQIAWNSYPGIYQLQPLLEVIRIIDPVHLTAGDLFQEWIVAFIAETIDIFQYDDGKKFWKVMNSYPLLRMSVQDKRREVLKNNQERYMDVQALLWSRGVDGN